MAIVTVKDLKKKYGQVKAVDGISFSIKKGEVFGLLGPNGAGKTSTINMMIGLSRPSSGHIIIDGYDAIKETKKVQKLIGIVPDSNNLYDEMSGFDNLCFCASLYGMGKRERKKRAAQLLDQFDLSHAGNRPFRTYSKGMKRKLTIAAGIIHNPKILFLDEPTTGIDVKSARQIRELILNLKREGKTILLTTHYIEEAERICDRIAFIVKGKIVKIDSVEGLVKNLEGGYKVRLRVKGDVKGVKEEVEESFRKCKLELVDGNSLLISSKEPMPLFPLIQLLDRKGIEVYEARELKASLEDIFVKITNAEALKQDKKEKVGM